MGFSIAELTMNGKVFFLLYDKLFLIFFLERCYANQISKQISFYQPPITSLRPWQCYGAWPWRGRFITVASRKTP